MGDLEDKIKKELLKSGFPLEVFCQRTLRNNRWSVSGPQQISMGENRITEIDIQANTQYQMGGDSTIFFTLHIECKKNRENPWVFFKNMLPIMVLSVEYENIKPNRSMKEWRAPIYEMKEHHFHKTPFSSIYTMVFKQNANQIYEAISSVLSSYQFFSDFYRKHRKENSPRSIMIFVDYLTIVFDGKLYLADVDSSDNIQLNEAQHLIYYHHKVEYPKHQHYNIEIVTRDYLDTYLKILNRDNKITVGFYKELLSQITPNEN